MSTTSRGWHEQISNTCQGKLVRGFITIKEGIKVKHTEILLATTILLDQLLFNLYVTQCLYIVTGHSDAFHFVHFIENSALNSLRIQHLIYRH
jgi:hypothetical protein